MNNSKILGMLGLATRARKIVTGETIFVALKKQQAKLVLISNEASENTKKKLMDKCQYYNIAFEFFDENSLNLAIGEFNKKAVAITDEGMSKKIKQYMKG